MYKNDAVVTNRWLYLTGWFLFVCTLCLSVVNFLNLAVMDGYAGFETVAHFIDDEFYSSIYNYVTGVSFVFFGMYLYSLRKKCLTAELLPRTFAIWIMRRWHRIRYRRGANKRKHELYA